MIVVVIGAVITVVVFIVLSSLQIQKNMKETNAVMDQLRKRVDDLATRLQAQQYREIEDLCRAGNGTFDSNRQMCIFSDGRTPLKFTALPLK